MISPRIEAWNNAVRVLETSTVSSTVAHHHGLLQHWHLALIAGMRIAREIDLRKAIETGEISPREVAAGGIFMKCLWPVLDEFCQLRIGHYGGCSDLRQEVR